MHMSIEFGQLEESLGKVVSGVMPDVIDNSNNQ